MKKLKVNSGTCIGCGACIAICPEYFDFKDGISTVLKENVETPSDELIEAIESCPVTAITLEEINSELDK